MIENRVRVSPEAEQDLAEIVEYIANWDSVDRADHVLEKLLDVCERLEQLPERGHFPPELLSLGIKSYREVQFKPFRIVCEVFAREDFILLIVDGRRSLQTILEQRLLR